MPGKEESKPKPGGSGGELVPANVPALPSLIQPSPPKSPQISDILRIEASLKAEFLGPLPSPETLERFEKLVPGSAARIIALAESQTKHRQDLERTVIQGNERRANNGLQAGFVIAMTAMVGAVILGLCGQPWLAGVFVGGTLLSLVSVFVTGTKSQRQEREEKAKIMSAANEAQRGQTGQSSPNPSADA